jgi:hypothetical protein
MLSRVGSLLITRSAARAPTARAATDRTEKRRVEPQPASNTEADVKPLLFNTTSANQSNQKPDNSSTGGSSMVGWIFLGNFLGSDSCAESYRVQLSVLAFIL